MGRVQQSQSDLMSQGTFMGKAQSDNMSTVSYIKRVQDGHDFDDEESEWGKGTDLEASQKNKELNDSDTEIINDKNSDSIADENQ